MNNRTPHPDQIAHVRAVSRVPHCDAKRALRKGFKFPIKLTYDEAKTALSVIKELEGRSDGVAVVFPRRSPTRLHRHPSFNKEPFAVWFKSEELATYVKLMI